MKEEQASTFLAARGMCWPVVLSSISRTILKSARHHAVALICGVNIFEDAAHPRVVTDVVVGYSRPAKGIKDIDDNAESLHISGKMSVHHLYIRNCLRTDILVGIIVIHHHDVPGHLTIDGH